jgi:repressor LexA
VLTKRQHELMVFLVHYQETHSHSPSYEEIAQALHLKSKSAVSSLINNLVKRGYCRRVPNRARSIQILKPIEDNNRNTKSLISSSEGVVSVPFFGTLGNSASLDLLSVPQSVLKIAKDSLPQGPDFRAFDVKGEYLKDWGILPGDNIVFKTTNESINGGVMLISRGKYLMVRKLEHAGHKVILKTANRFTIPELYPKEDIAVHGILVFASRCIACN